MICSPTWCIRSARCRAIARAAGSTVSYVKPHGALYNTIVTNREQAAAVARRCTWWTPTLPVLGMAGSASSTRRPPGLTHRGRGVRRSAYRQDGQLVSRREPGAVLHDPAEIAERVVTMVTSGEVTAIDGSQLAVTVESVCVHGDSPGAVQIATAVRDQLRPHGVDIKAFC